MNSISLPKMFIWCSQLHYKSCYIPMALLLIHVSWEIIFSLQDEGIGILLGGNDCDENPDSVEEAPMQYSKIVHVLLLFLFLWQTVFRVSDAGLSMMLAFMVSFLQCCGKCLRLGIAKRCF